MYVLPVTTTQFTSFLPLLSVLLQAILAVSSVKINYTIDNQLGDTLTGAVPAYSPPNGWAHGNDCSGCGIQPGTGGVDVSQVFCGTWQDSTYYPGQPGRTISVSFTGTAVYVFNLIANNFGQEVATLTNLTFSIDNTGIVRQYTHEPDNTRTILYRVPVYINTSLSNSEHSLTIVAGGASASLILFDYIVYTADNGIDPSSSNSSLTSSNTATTLSSPSSPPSSGTSPTRSLSSSRNSSTPVGAIVGGTVGGVCALIIIAAACLCICRGRTSRSPSLPGRVDPSIAILTAEASPGQPVTRRLSRALVLPALKLERIRLILIPGVVGSSTPASPGIPDPHRSHLPPLSVAGTNSSQLHTELIQRIQALEAQMGVVDADSEQKQLSSSGSGTVSSSELRSSLSALQHEIAKLRAEFFQRLLTEAAPPYTD